MRARFRRFCVGVVVVGLFVACVPLAYALPASVQLGAALAGFGAALGTLGGLAVLWLFDYARKQAGKKKCAGTTVPRQYRPVVGGNVVPVKSKESLPARL